MTPAIPPLAVTLGDPAGIGPELIVRAWLRREELDLPRFVVIGDAEVLEGAARRLGLDPPAIPTCEDAGLACAYTPGTPDEIGARAALRALEVAGRKALAGEISGVVTAPVSKAQIAKIAPGFLGQTEFFAQACNFEVEDAVMLLAGPSLRTVPVTVHCPLAEVSGRLSIELIERRARIVSAALTRDFGIAAPRIAIAGLNPHAGEGGLLGREEIEIIGPAIAALRAAGIDATGPHPADALFAPHARGTYDVAIAMYHDQALVPIKALDFDEGVNVTLGLPIVRTSPDHGTAFGIAGTGTAHPGAMIAAIRMAGQIAVERARLG